MSRGAPSHAHIMLRTRAARRTPGGTALRRLEEERAYEGDAVRRLRRGTEERKETGAGRRARKLVRPSQGRVSAAVPRDVRHVQYESGTTGSTIREG